LHSGENGIYGYFQGKLQNTDCRQAVFMRKCGAEGTFTEKQTWRGFNFLERGNFEYK
jgi:hypothetical protein